MDSFEWNKIIGAVLGTAIFVFVVRLVAEKIYEPEKPAKPGYVVEGVVETVERDGFRRLRMVLRWRIDRIARTIDVLLISVSTLSIAAFLLAAFVIHRVEVVTHIFTMHLRLSQTHAVAISLEAVAVAGLIFSALMWILVAIATPLPGFLGGIVQERIPADLRERFTKNAA